MVNNANPTDQRRFKKYGINTEEIEARLQIKLEHVNKGSLPTETFFSNHPN
jgi:hypothetical protein